MAYISAACQVIVDLLHESPYWDKNIKPDKYFLYFFSRDTLDYIG